MPVGSPAASRRIFPPAGSGVSLVTPASASAFEFTHAAWPSMRESMTGMSAQTRSRSPAVGYRFSGQSF